MREVRKHAKGRRQIPVVRAALSLAHSLTSESDNIHREGERERAYDFDLLHLKRQTNGTCRRCNQEIMFITDKFIS